MKDTTKLALQVAGIGATAAAAFVGFKLLKNKGAVEVFTKKAGDAVVEASSDISDAAKEVVDEVAE